MEEYEEIDYYLRPSKKNQRVLGICFAVISTLSIVLSVTEYYAVSDSYVSFDFIIFTHSSTKIFCILSQRVFSLFLLFNLQKQHLG